MTGRRVLALDRVALVCFMVVALVIACMGGCDLSPSEVRLSVDGGR